MRLFLRKAAGRPAGWLARWLPCFSSELTGFLATDGVQIRGHNSSLKERGTSLSLERGGERDGGKNKKGKREGGGRREDGRVGSIDSRSGRLCKLTLQYRTQKVKASIPSPRRQRRRTTKRNFSSVPFIGCVEWIGRGDDDDGAIFSGVARMGGGVKGETGRGQARRQQVARFFLNAKSMGKGDDGDKVASASVRVRPMDIVQLGKTATKTRPAPST